MSHADPAPDPTPDPVDAILDAALPHVPFDGWSEATLRAAVQDAGIDRELARTLLPRGASDLALAYHRRGDAEMVAALGAMDLGALRFRDRIATAVRLRLEHADREVVRRGSTLFALPRNAPRGSRALWGTADAIWTALGDTSEDHNWYTKRATLSAVIAATVLYWLGDDSPDARDTWAFLDRRIADVMRFEQAKARVKAAPVLGPLARLPGRVLSRVRPPRPRVLRDVPGVWPAAGSD